MIMYVYIYIYMICIFVLSIIVIQISRHQKQIERSEDVVCKAFYSDSDSVSKVLGQPTIAGSSTAIGPVCFTKNSAKEEGSGLLRAPCRILRDNIEGANLRSIEHGVQSV